MTTDYWRQKEDAEFEKAFAEAAIAEVNTTSTITEWIVIIVVLFVMASIWTALKEPVYNFGQSYPITSTVSVALIFGFLWWFLVVKGPKASAQSQQQTPAIQQSIGNVSGGSTVNQAGANITINQGVSEETIRQLIDQKAVSAQAQLNLRYPKGYVILGMASGKVIFYSEKAPKNLQIDWKSSDIKISSNKKDVWVRVPDIYVIDRDITINNFNAGFHYSNGAIQHLAKISDDTLDAEVLDANYGILIVGLK